MPPVSIVGCGYVGCRLARRWRDGGTEVTGYAVSEASRARIAAAGATAVALDLDVEAPAPLALAGHRVYYAVPPPPTGERDGRLERWLDCITGTPARIVYLSTTGVYGDRGGERVDEDCPARPRTPRAVRRLAAEQALRDWAQARDVSWCVLRIPGIYGPQRLPVERLARGDPAIRPEEASPGNRVHVEDLVTACAAAGSSPRAHRRIYNIGDGSEESAVAFLQRVARITGLPPPPLVSRAEAARTFSESSWSFLGESRRIDNRRMVEELGVALRYRDLDQGIRDSL